MAKSTIESGIQGEAPAKFVAYHRVSTAKQGRSGLGLEAQRAAVLQYLNGGSWDLIGEYTEVESGKNTERPELQKALEFAELPDGPFRRWRYSRAQLEQAALLPPLGRSPAVKTGSEKMAFISSRSKPLFSRRGGRLPTL